jgi:SAM-dependent methyltransferase
MEDDLAAATARIWDRNAAFWDARMADGNDFHLLLVRPAAERLLALRHDERVLDLGCGNGLFARRLAELGARVLGCDVSPRMIDLARARGDGGGRIEYRVADATDERQIAALGAGGDGFDAAVANMVLMDIPTLEPLARGLAAALRPGGRFVLTVAHPCFHSSGTALAMEEVVEDGRPATAHTVRVKRYLSLGPARGVAIVGQPEVQYYFDRPLSVLLAPFFAAGFALDGLEEPAFPAAEAGARPSLWDAHREIPPVLAARLRLGSR